MSTRTMLGAVVCLAMLGRALPAQTPPELWRSWSNVATLQAGEKIAVQTSQPKQKLKGTFQSGNDAGITIRTAGGEQTIAKENVYRIARNQSLRPALLIGAASGVAVYAIVAPRSDFTASGHFVFGAAFAGIGALVGAAVGSASRSKPIYEAPKR